MIFLLVTLNIGKCISDDITQLQKHLHNPISLLGHNSVRDIMITVYNIVIIVLLPFIRYLNFMCVLIVQRG